MPIYSFRTGDMAWPRSQANCLHIPFWQVELHRKSNYRSEDFLVILEIEQRRWMLSCNISLINFSSPFQGYLCLPSNLRVPSPLVKFQYTEGRGSEDKSVCHLYKIIKANKLNATEGVADLGTIPIISSSACILFEDFRITLLVMSTHFFCSWL